ncbi:integral membrane protein [Macrophomina phaseolina MS6]|uniref:Integral membrane protein n=2 Tax=Macrophomina phaseolina TaxID=35725 RepID=K2SXJ0_MACPH|nr:integral membrane protein [Macrophomina phaseolina MS6]KAH7058713.1 PAP2 superfamily-domain-containing protein [Macrophomina phaseolina]
MGAFKNLIEPGSIVLGFTAGTLINRRRAIRESERELHAPLLSAPRGASPSPTPQFYPDNTRFRNNLISRFLAKFPFLLEIWYWNLTYWVYQLARALTATIIRGNEAIFARAQAHAISILSFETRLHIAIELPIQKYILNHQPWLMTIFAKIYYSHIFVGVVFLVYIYTYLPTATFRKIRRTIAANNAIAFIVLSIYRCMPPRMLPPEYGFVDVLHSSVTNPGSAWTHNRFQLTIAAMPSLHFGTSLFLAVCLLRFSPHRMLRVVALLWPLAMLLTILATANHFVCDALVGSMVPVVGWRVNRWICVLEPLEQWGFWVCRTEKPEPFAWGRAKAYGEVRRSPASSGAASPQPWKDAESIV